VRNLQVLEANTGWMEAETESKDSSRSSTQADEYQTDVGKKRGDLGEAILRERAQLCSISVDKDKTSRLEVGKRRMEITGKKGVTGLPAPAWRLEKRKKGGGSQEREGHQGTPTELMR